MKLGGLDISTVKLGASQVQAIYQGQNLVWQNAPVATAATGVGQTSFTANWEAYTGAVVYLLDVSTSPSFDTFIYQNQQVNAPTTSYVVIGLEPNTTYYYRVRASTEALPLLLNDYPNAAAAYSLRLLDNTYTGSAIRVRRSSDNTEQDIGFVNNELDTSTLTSFCSGTDGFVKTWYDQSGNGRDATQPTAASQPKIVSSGTVLVDSFGKPRIQGYQNNLTNLKASFSSGQPISVFAVVDYTSLSTPTGFPYGVDLRSSSSNLIAVGLVGSSARIYAGSNLYNTTTILSNTTYLSYGLINDTNSSIGINTNITNGSAGTSTADGICLFNSRDLVAALNGYLSEVIIYPSNQSTNRTGIETNINDFYSIY